MGTLEGERSRGIAKRHLSDLTTWADTLTELDSDRCRQAIEHGSSSIRGADISLAMDTFDNDDNQERRRAIIIGQPPPVRSKPIIDSGCRSLLMGVRRTPVSDLRLHTHVSPAHLSSNQNGYAMTRPYT